MKKFITGLMCALGILFCLWFVASWIDVIVDNCDSNPVHSEYNLFVLMSKNN